jgi:hypothetical protein
MLAFLLTAFLLTTRLTAQPDAVATHTAYYNSTGRGGINGGPEYVYTLLFCGDCTNMTTGDYATERRGYMYGGVDESSAGVLRIVLDYDNYNIRCNLVWANAEWIGQLLELEKAARIAEINEVFGSDIYGFALAEMQKCMAGEPSAKAFAYPPGTIALGAIYGIVGLLVLIAGLLACFSRLWRHSEMVYHVAREMGHIGRGLGLI